MMASRQKTWSSISRYYTEQYNMIELTLEPPTPPQLDGEQPCIDKVISVCHVVVSLGPIDHIIQNSFHASAIAPQAMDEWRN